MRYHVIVTGASRGIGLEVSSKFLQEGWDVIACSRSKEPPVRLVSDAKQNRRNLEWFSVDLSDRNSIRGFFDSPSIRNTSHNAFVHCAAQLGPSGLVGELDVDEWNLAIMTNVIGTFMILQGAIELLAGSGNIVILSGGGATSAMPHYSAYAASKAAIVRLVENTAIEYSKSGMILTAVAPGMIATDMLKELVGAGPEVMGARAYESAISVLNNPESTLGNAIDLIFALSTTRNLHLSGKLIAAQWDPWRNWVFDENFQLPADVANLRRIAPPES